MSVSFLLVLSVHALTKDFKRFFYRGVSEANIYKVNPQYFFEAGDCHTATGCCRIAWINYYMNKVPEPGTLPISEATRKAASRPQYVKGGNAKSMEGMPFLLTSHLRGFFCFDIRTDVYPIIQRLEHTTEVRVAPRMFVMTCPPPKRFKQHRTKVYVDLVKFKPNSQMTWTVECIDNVVRSALLSALRKSCLPNLTGLFQSDSTYLIYIEGGDDIQHLIVTGYDVERTSSFGIVTTETYDTEAVEITVGIRESVQICASRPKYDVASQLYLVASYMAV